MQARHPSGSRTALALPAWPARVLLEMLLLMILCAVAWLYWLFGRTLPTGALAGAWLLAATPISAVLYRRARRRRRLLLDAYLQPATRLNRMLRGGALLAIRCALPGLLLGLVLTVALLRIPDQQTWLLLLGAAPALALSRAGFAHVLASQASPRYLPELAAHAALLVAGAALLVLLLWLAMNRSYPLLGDVALDRAVWHLVDQEEARSAAMQLLLQLAAAKDGLRLWLGQQLLPVPLPSAAQWLAWLLLLAEELLFVWSYLLMCTGTLLLVQRNDDPHG
ncbi:MAG: hypothetical protein JJT85_09225 [Chromatiales bacterium]|nr:hypothetical protein [Chromatiales bacterium]